MVSPHIQVKYDALANVATYFARQTEGVENMRLHLERSFRLLQDGGWIGKGASAFFQEMDEDIFPALMRLTQALEQAQSVAIQTSIILTIAEDEAASLFQSNSNINSDSVTLNDFIIASTTTNGDRPDLDTKFAEFTVPTADKDGMVQVPDKWMSDLFGLQRRPVTMTEKRMMDEIGLLGQKDLYYIQKEAFEMAEKFAGANGQEDGLGDAYRHAYWNALMVNRFGADWAKQYGDAHESLPNNPKTKAFMDLWNNSIGITIAQENPNISKQELANKIAEAVRSGKTVIIDGATQKPIYSDQAPNVKDLPNPQAAST